MPLVLGRVRAMASRARCIALALGLGCGAGSPGSARAATDVPPPAVRWTAPDECPADAFTDALDRLLAGSSLAAPLRVEATVERTADGWSIHTAFDAGPGRAGERTFQALTCRTVTQAAALAIAIAVDPSVLDRLVAPAHGSPVGSEASPIESPEPALPEPVLPEPAPVLPEPLPSSARPTEPPLGPIVAAAPTGAAGGMHAEPSSRWRGLLGVAGLLDGGALPGPGGGLAGTVGVLHGRFRGELVGSHRFATRQAAASDPRVGGELTQWSVGVRGCGVPQLGEVELPLCVGLDAGQTVGRGTGLREPFTSAQPWLAGLAEAGVAWPVRRWLALTARASLAVPVLRQDFTITGLGVVHRVGPVQGRGLVGLELRWP